MSAKDGPFRFIEGTTGGDFQVNETIVLSLQQYLRVVVGIADGKPGGHHTHRIAAVAGALAVAITAMTRYRD